MYNIVQVVMQLKQVVCQQSKIQYILSLNVQLSARFLNYLKDYSTYLENRLFKHFFFYLHLYYWYQTRTVVRFDFSL